MSEATARATLYSRLSETIGVDNAGTLMSYLPGDKPATAAQLDGLEKATAAQFARVDDRFEKLEKSMTERFRRVDERLDRLEDKLDRRLDEFHFALLAQGRTYVVATVGSVISTAGLVAAAVYAFG